MRRLSLIFASMLAVLAVAWAAIRRWGGSLFFEPTRPSKGFRTLFREEDIVRREAQKARIEAHRTATDKEVRCQADAARKRAEDKFGK